MGPWGIKNYYGLEFCCCLFYVSRLISIKIYRVRLIWLTWAYRAHGHILLFIKTPLTLAILEGDLNLLGNERWKIKDNLNLLRYGRWPNFLAMEDDLPPYYSKWKTTSIFLWLEDDHNYFEWPNLLLAYWRELHYKVHKKTRSIPF